GAGSGEGGVRGAAAHPGRVVDAVLALADPARARRVPRAQAAVQRVPAVAPLPAPRRHRVGMRRRAVAILVVLACGTLPAHAEPQPPFALFGDESVASTDDARALFVNPAAIGWRYPSELLGANSDRGQGSSRATGAATWRRLAFGFAHQAGVAGSYGLGFSLGDEHASVGWVTNRRDDLAGPRERDYDSNVGWLSRPAAWTSTG